jgi:hypothetical protein
LCKKDAEIFADSKNVATFASAFEKTRFLQRSRVDVKELEVLGRTVEFRKKCNVLEKIFAGLKKMTYLCSPFALQNADFFNRFFELLVIFERKNVVFICQFPLRE